MHQTRQDTQASNPAPRADRPTSARSPHHPAKAQRPTRNRIPKQAQAPPAHKSTASPKKASDCQDGSAEDCALRRDSTHSKSDRSSADSSDAVTQPNSMSLAICKFSPGHARGYIQFLMSTVAIHAIWTTYMTWPPGDRRGHWSALFDLYGALIERGHKLNLPHPITLERATSLANEPPAS